MIDACKPEDFPAILEIVNDAAQAYRGVIPFDRWHDPYMSEGELREEIAKGIRFWGFETDGKLLGVMGIQGVEDVTLIRHAYVRSHLWRAGIGGQLLRHLMGLAETRVYVGTWAAADWAIRFYEKHGFRRVAPTVNGGLQRKYWKVPEAQVQTSVVLEYT